MVRCRGGVAAPSKNLTQITSGPDEDKPGVGRERVRREERSGRSKWVLSRMASMVDRVQVRADLIVTSTKLTICAHISMFTYIASAAQTCPDVM